MELSDFVEDPVFSDRVAAKPLELSRILKKVFITRDTSVLKFKMVGGVWQRQPGVHYKADSGAMRTKGDLFRLITNRFLRDEDEVVVKDYNIAFGADIKFLNEGEGGEIVGVAITTNYDEDLYVRAI